MEELLKHLGVALNYTQELLIVALILGRTMPMVMLTPFFGGKIAPPEVKMGLGVLMTGILWPVARGAITEPIPITPVPFLLLMLKEVFIGYVVGFINQHIFNIMDMAGRLIDTARGSSMAEVLEPNSGHRESMFGNMYTQMLLIIFVAIGGHEVFIDAFFRSFAAIPINVGLPDVAQLGILSDHLIHQTSYLLLAAVMMSTPIIATTLITDIVFGILNRVAPQLNAYFMSMPVKAMGGVALAVAIMEPFKDRMEGFVLWSLQRVEDALNLLARHG